MYPSIYPFGKSNRFESSKSIFAVITELSGIRGTTCPLACRIGCVAVEAVRDAMIRESRGIGGILATIGDVAKAAGVSRSTVSYALSGKRSISQETRDRINAAIAELGFTVNAGARALATAHTMVVGLHLRFETDEFAPAMLQYVLPVTDSARDLGYDTLLMTEATGPAAIQRVTSSNMVDGLILLDVVDDDDRLEVLRTTRQPSVLIGLPSDVSGLDAIDLDFAEAGRILVDQLYGAGHRRVLLITPPAHVFERGGGYAKRFRSGAVERAARVGVELDVEPGESQEPLIHDRLNDLLDRYADVTAIIVHNDASVAALPGVLREREITVPENLSIVSLFSESFARTFNLGYSAIDTNPDRIGSLAVEQLVRRVSRPDGAGEPGVRLVSPSFVDRGSVADIR
jgi:DNA-binding LacI/PurR family transcriptional regulator